MEIPSPSKPVNSFEASLMMKCYVVSAPTSAPTSNLNDKAIRAIKSTVGKDSSYRKEEMQVVDLFAPKQKNQLEFYIFDPHKYPVSSNEKELKSSRENLLKAIREAGKDNSAEYRCQRTYKKQPTYIEKQEGRSFYQSDLYCLRTLVKSGNNGSEHSEYTAYSSTNGKRRLFSEPGGNKKKKRMTSSAMATSIESKCTCPALHIYSNGYCFFAMRRTTSSFHSGHKQKFSASELSMGSSKLPEFIEKNRMIMSLATGSAVAQARGVRTLSAGQFNITKQAMKNAGKKDTQDLNESKFTKEYLQSIDSAEEMKELLHYHGNTVLIICKKKEAENSNSTIDNVIPTSTVKMSVSDSTSDINIEDVEKMTKELDTSDVEDLLCIGWCSPNMKKMAQAFPQSLSIDGTFKTVQVDNMTHLTVTTKNTLGKTVVVLRLFIPNESKWMFRYVLMVAIPNLLGKEICRKVRRFAPVSDWSVQDRERYEAFVSLNPTTRLGTPIELCGSVVDEVDWSAVIDKRWDKESLSPNRSATEWDRLPSSHRVLNYDCKEVLSSLKMMKDSKSDEVNMNLFKMELSQGGEIITQHEGYDTSTSPNFEHRLEYSDRFEFSTADNRKAELTKMFHQVLNSTNLNDSMMYKLLHSQLSNLSDSARDLNELIQGDCNEEEEHDGLTRFPNKNFGPNGRDMISRRR